MQVKNIIMGPEQYGLIIVGVLTLFGTVVSSWLSYLARSHARQANNAVNNRKPGSKSLYDLVLENQVKAFEISADMNKIKADVEETKFRVTRIEKHCPACKEE